MTTIIPAGYRVSITTWENDADNYRTKVLEGLSEARARYLAELANLFTRKNCHQGLDVANLYEPSEIEQGRVIKAFKALAKKHPAEFTEAEDDDWHDWVSNELYDMELGGGDFWTRVTETIKVEHIQQAIELADVTKQFVK